MNDTSKQVAKSNRLPDDGFYDGFDLLIAEHKAAGIVAEANSVPDWEFENNFVRSSIQHEAYSLVDVSIISIGSHPDYRPTEADFWERVIDGVREAVAVPAEIVQEPIAPAPIATPPELTELRLKLRSNGYHPVPVIGAHVPDKAAGKRPTMTAWQTKCLTADPLEIASWSRSQRNNTNTGVLCGDVVGVDIDVLDDALSAKLVARALELFGPTSMCRIGRAPKTLLLYRVETRHEKLSTPELLLGVGKSQGRNPRPGPTFRCVWHSS
jgi:bifunctional DNA primase/polymerase-like protein